MEVCRQLIAFLKQSKAVYGDGFKQFGLDIDDALAWLEKQGEHANFRNKIQIGDKVTHNEDGVLVNLSQLNRVAKKQGEQKPTIEMKSAEESLGIDSDTYNKIVDECIYGEQKPAWSEEDEEMFDFAIRAIGLCKQYAINHQVSGYSKLPDVPERYEELQNWLKSLRPKSQWKPSDAQMYNLSEAAHYRCAFFSTDVLIGLYDDLKKLREE